MNKNGARFGPTTALLPPLLTALEALEHVGRSLHPPRLPSLVAETRDAANAVRDGLRQLQVAGSPEQPGTFKVQLQVAAEHVCLAFDGLEQAPADPNGLLLAYRALRANARALEALYPLARAVPAVSRFFVEPALRDDPALARRLSPAAAPRADVGVLHFDNALDSRGGFSLYVPEYYDPGNAHPLIVALHGGSGHGADFLWTWLREARSRGAILVSPTALGRTWSLGSPDVDGANIANILAFVRERWNVNPERTLLTGMSDGGTFTLVTGLRPRSSFTHLAACSSSFHLSLVDRSTPERLTGLPVYLVHGLLDWMFPVDFARIANAALTRAGAKVVLREIADLSHTYPREENPRIMDWFLGSL